MFIDRHNIGVDTDFAILGQIVNKLQLFNGIGGHLGRRHLTILDYLITDEYSNIIIPYH
jgi:hypothetical protein